MAMSYTKGVTIDLGKDSNGIPAKGNATITEETMHDLPDSENEDDDTVLINGGVFSETTTRKVKRKYGGLLLKILLVMLIAGVLVLSCFVHLLQNDLNSMHESLNAQKSELAKNKRNDEATRKELTRNVTDDRSQDIGESAATLLKKIGNINDTVSMLNSRGSVYYPQYNARFVGFGYPSNRTGWVDHSDHTLKQCLEKLYEKREKDHQWNGVVFAHKKKKGWCICYQNSMTLDMPNNSYMYYIFND